MTSGLQVAIVRFDRPSVMGRLFGLVGATVLGYIGWFAGMLVGITTAVILSVIGTGLGIYYGRKVARYYS